MKKIKKAIGIAACIFLAMSSLGGCGTDNAKEEKKAASTKNTSETEDKDSSTENNAVWKPERAVNVICNTGAGGMTDLVTRAMCQSLEEIMGVSFQVTNMTGGSGAVANSYVFDKPRDGYTILGTSGGGLNALPVLGGFDKTSKEYDICMTLASDAILSVPSGSPYKSAEELIEAAKAGTLSAGASQAGSCWQIMLSQLQKKGEFTANVIPYEGSAPTHVGALSNEVDFVVTGLSEQREYILAKKLVPLAVLDKESVELEGYGTIPSIADTIPEFKDVSDAIGNISWVGIGLPADTPDNIKSAYEAAFKQALESKQVQEINESLGTHMIGLVGEEARADLDMLDSIFMWELYDGGIAQTSPEKFNIPRPE